MRCLRWIILTVSLIILLSTLNFVKLSEGQIFDHAQKSLIVSPLAALIVLLVIALGSITVVFIIVTMTKKNLITFLIERALILKLYQLQSLKIILYQSLKVSLKLNFEIFHTLRAKSLSELKYLLPELVVTMKMILSFLEKQYLPIMPLLSIEEVIFI